jgi:hypothetical protein
VAKFFADVLYRHLADQLGLNEKDGGKWLVAFCFTQQDAFKELVRASEGVPRDYLEIFNLAYFDALARKDQKVGVPNIRKAARGWYLQDKFNPAQDEPRLLKFINRVFDSAIGEHRARTFMVDQSFSRHPIITKLFDLRLLHLIKRGYAAKRPAGVRYDIFSLDYGAYVDLINTAKEPQIEFEFSEKEKITLGEDFFNEFPVEENLPI